MATTELTGSTIGQTIKDNEIVLVDFWASWCGPCRMFAPIYEEAAQSNDDIVFGSVNTEEQQSLAAAAKVSSIPTLMAFKKGKLVFNQAGALPLAALEDLVQQIKAFDIDAAIAEEANSEQA